MPNQSKAITCSLSDKKKQCSGSQVMQIADTIHLLFGQYTYIVHIYSLLGHP